MNLLVPVSWLAEYVETDLSPEELALLGSLHGPSFERIEQIEGEQVYDIEVTTNRVDSMSIKGLARELAAIGGDRVKKRQLDAKTVADLRVETTPLPLPRITVETGAVKKIQCLVLDKVKNIESPDFMVKRLHQIGQNSHGVIIDMTNYVTHELGHPCHAFDYDKIMALGGEIIVKQASPGKKFVTLDGQEHETLGGEVVFENAKGEIIDLPAIKGTANSAIDSSTTRVLFWLENMDAAVVRQTSMSHAIRTVAAILNEKNVDPYLTGEVLVLGTQILQKYAGAKIASEVYTWENESALDERQEINLNLARLNAYLGVTIEASRVRELLEALEFEIIDQTETAMTVRPPTFRAHDVTIEQDLIEEVARLYGYHNLPSRLDFPSVVLPTQPQFDFRLENQMKHFLVANGLTEVYTYSMIAENQLTDKAEKFLRLANPLTEDKVYLRQSLVASLEQVYADNQVDPRECAGIFELASVYFPGETQDTVDERTMLTLVTTLDYRQSRRLVENLLHLANLTVEIDDNGQIVSDGQRLGQVRLLAGNKVSWELDLGQVVALRRPVQIKARVSSYPVVREDLTFVVKSGQISSLIQEMKHVSPLVRAVRLGEIYQDHYTFHLEYQSDARVLTSEQLRPIREQIVTTLAKQGCALVGELP